MREGNVELIWEDGFEIWVKTDGKGVTVSANRAGLLSLAAHLNALAREAPGAHIHLDDYNALEDGSAELIIEKLD